MSEYTYRVWPPGCRPGQWYRCRGETIEHALIEECRNGVTTNGEPVRVEVKEDDYGSGLWWLNSRLEVVCTAQRCSSELEEADDE